MIEFRLSDVSSLIPYQGNVRYMNRHCHDGEGGGDGGDDISDTDIMLSCYISVIYLSEIYIFMGFKCGLCSANVLHLELLLLTYIFLRLGHEQFITNVLFRGM